MKCDKEKLLLYAVTDSSYLGDQKLAHQVEDAILGGATIIQLREKNLATDKFIELAKEVKAVTDKYKIPLIINDDIDAALAANVDGVHVGQHDMNARTAREKIGKDKILGVSAQTVEQALLAEKNGADYLGVGAVFSTSTKSDADDVSFETLKAICEAVNIPVVAIGGINKDNICKLKNSGIAGVAVVSAIFAQDDIKKATRELRIQVEEMVGVVR